MGHEQKSAETFDSYLWSALKADFQSVEFSERSEIPLFAGEMSL